jgi:hypothetical protein
MTSPTRGCPVPTVPGRGGEHGSQNTCESLGHDCTRPDDTPSRFHHGLRGTSGSASTRMMSQYSRGPGAYPTRPHMGPVQEVGPRQQGWDLEVSKRERMKVARPVKRQGEAGGARAHPACPHVGHVQEVGPRPGPVGHEPGVVPRVVAGF